MKSVPTIYIYRRNTFSSNNMWESSVWITECRINCRQCLPLLGFPVFSFCASTARLGATPPHFWGFQTHPLELPWTSGQFVSEAAACTTPNEHNRRKSMPSVVFEPRPQQASGCRRTPRRQSPRHRPSSCPLQFLCCLLSKSNVVGHMTAVTEVGV